MRRHAYDANDNLTMDLNKDITYNTLNLPKRVDFGDMSHIDYTYSADGTKLRTEHFVNGQDTVSTDYCGSLIYEDGARKHLLTDVGYVTGLNTTPLYHYYLKDHQGNNRVVVNQNGDVDEENNYYPFGGFYTYYESQRNVQPYKYNGKEFDGRKNLNLYDYGARFYDPALGRFTSVDNYAEKYYPMTPYQYGANNPVKNIDVDGEWPWAVVGAALDYGLQVYDNYKKGKSGYDAWVGDINFVSVALSSVNIAGKYKAIKTLGIELAKSTFKYTPNENKLKVNDNQGEIVKQTIIGTITSVGAQSIVSKSSDEALKRAHKESFWANSDLRKAKTRLCSKPKSVNLQKAVESAKQAQQQARNKEVVTIMLNGTIGNMDPNFVEFVITNTKDTYNIIFNEHEKEEELKNK